ncbi:MAG: hypothetical protein AB8B56_13395 [Crocinitomicaceae bacterium]
MKILNLLFMLLFSAAAFSQEPLFCPPVIASPTWTPGANKLFVHCPSVNVGLGTSFPSDRLHIVTNDDQGISFVPTGWSQRSRIQFLDPTQNPNWDITAYHNFVGGYGNILEFNSHKDGKFWVNRATMLIGNTFDFSGCTDCEEYRLFVKKGIRTQKIKVDIGSGIWADYVFTPEYKLMPINDLEQYISTNNHLPGIPSSSEVEEQGVDLGEMDAKLLEKIEELTLYVIDLQKQVEELKENQNH